MKKNIEIQEVRSSPKENTEKQKSANPEKFEKEQKAKFEKVKENRAKENKAKPGVLNRLDKKLEEQKLKDEFAAKKSKIEGLRGIEVQIKGTKYPFKFSAFLLDGGMETGAGIQKKLEKGEVTIGSGRVKTRIALEKERGGTKMSIDIPVGNLLRGEAGPYIRRTCENIFGGTLEWYNRQSAGKTKEANKEDPGNKERKEEVKEKARQKRGVVAVMETGSLISLTIFPKPEKQLKMSSYTGAVWEVEEEAGGRIVSQENVIEYLGASG